MMANLNKCLACCAVLLCGSVNQAYAASSAASSASDSVGTSVGSASGSIQTSSGSSKGNDVTEGDYKIVAVTEAEDRPGLVRMKLQAVAGRSGDGELLLFLPQAAYDNGELALGNTVSARKRAYGVEFANADTRQAFFLVLNDDWYRELRVKPVLL